MPDWSNKSERDGFFRKLKKEVSYHDFFEEEATQLENLMAHYVKPGGSLEITMQKWSDTLRILDHISMKKDEDLYVFTDDIYVEMEQVQVKNHPDWTDLDTFEYTNNKGQTFRGNLPRHAPQDQVRFAIKTHIREQMVSPQLRELTLQQRVKLIHSLPEAATCPAINYHAKLPGTNFDVLFKKKEIKNRTCWEPL